MELRVNLKNLTNFNFCCCEYESLIRIINANFKYFVSKILKLTLGNKNVLTFYPSYTYI